MDKTVPKKTVVPKKSEPPSNSTPKIDPTQQPKPVPIYEEQPVPPLIPFSNTSRLHTPAFLIPLLGLAPDQPAPFSILDLPRQVAAPPIPPALVEYPRQEFDRFVAPSRRGGTDAAGLLWDRGEKLAARGGLSREEKEELRLAEVAAAILSRR